MFAPFSNLDSGYKTAKQPISLQAVGHVENQIEEPVSSEIIRSVDSHIVIKPDLVEGIQGLEPGQEIMIIFQFHRSEEYELLQHPRGNKKVPKRGVFAIRTPNRPNFIGVTVVELLDINENVLTVKGLDAIAGTPVLDIKPA